MNAARLILFGAIAFVLSACAPKRIDPPLYTYDLPRLVSESARLHALQINGLLFIVANTHSMEPLLRGDDLIVVEQKPFDTLRNGEVITYRAEWAPSIAPPVCHRIVAIDSGGLLLSGDNVAHSESKFRVTRANYIGAVVAIYRLRK